MKLPIAGMQRHFSPKSLSKHATLSMCRHVLVLPEHSIKLLSVVLHVMDVVRSILVVTNKHHHMIQECSHGLGATMVEGRHEQFLLNVVSAHMRVCSVLKTVNWICAGHLSITKIGLIGSVHSCRTSAALPLSRVLVNTKHTKCCWSHCCPGCDFCLRLAQSCALHAAPIN